jgi:IS5 family transposase
MRSKERGDGGQRDLFVSRLDQIVNLQHALVKLSKAIDWGFLEQQLGAVYDAGPPSPADAADGGIGDPQTHAQSVG